MIDMIYFYSLLKVPIGDTLTKNNDTIDNNNIIHGNNSKRRITKKGILITILIGGGIIGASFPAYLIPQ